MLFRSYLAGAPLIAAVESVRAGHAMNHRVLTTLLADLSAWRYVASDGMDDETVIDRPRAAIA